jgi:hypothetical protein
METGREGSSFSIVIMITRVIDLKEKVPFSTPGSKIINKGIFVIVAEYLFYIEFKGRKICKK